MDDTSYVQRLDCETANEFLDNLSPRSPYFRGYVQPRRIIYRGQENAEWELVPSVFRSPIRYKDAEGWHIIKKPSNQDRIRYELSLAIRFCDLADSAGLEVPDKLELLRSELAEKMVDRSGTWPPKEFLPFLALAQHYGVPTRLLDWSLNPYVAAYFAAVEAAKRKKVPDVCECEEASPIEVPANQCHRCEKMIVPPKPFPERVSVWAMGATEVELAVREIMSAVIGPSLFDLVIIPRAKNPNLHAQEGVFTLSRPRNAELGSSEDWVSLNDIIKQQKYPAFKLYHFTLPFTQCPELLWLLAKEGINGAKLFPTYYGAAEALREELYWNPQPAPNNGMHPTPHQRASHES